MYGQSNRVQGEIEENSTLAYTTFMCYIDKNNNNSTNKNNNSTNNSTNKNNLILQLLIIVRLTPHHIFDIQILPKAIKISKDV